MSEFKVPIIRIRAIEPIPDADQIELAVVGDYRSVVRKGDYCPGDLAVYIPEGAVVPQELLGEMGLTGKLAGSNKDRVKAVRLRGCLSQGLLYNLSNKVVIKSGRIDKLIFQHGRYEEGHDMAGILGIIKYEPPIPVAMSGEVLSFHGYTVKYDIENFKAYPDVLEEGEPVEFTEKLHGTWCGITMSPGLFNPELPEGDMLIYSKGLGGQGLVFKDNDANKNNIYVRTIKNLNLRDKILSSFPGLQVTLIGEIYGKGIQDLHYGKPAPEFALFDIHIDNMNGDRYYLDRQFFHSTAEQLELPTVPVLYEGGFSHHIMTLYTEGKTTLSEGTHMREGIVIRPLKERHDSNLGRVILKSVNVEYLLRKGNVTEYN